jgi:aspartate ammonia-lyase
MTFAAYLRRWKSYTEDGYIFRQHIKQMPPELETPQDVYDWLRRIGVGNRVVTTAMNAAHDYRELVRRQAKRG